MLLIDNSLTFMLDLHCHLVIPADSAYSLQDYLMLNYILFGN